MQKRRRFIQTDILEVRLAHEAERLRAQAKKLLPGPRREEMLRRAHQFEDGARMSEWLRSPDMQPIR